MTPKYKDVFRLFGAALIVIGIASPAAAAGVFTHSSTITPWAPGGSGGCCHCKNVWKQVNIWKEININNSVNISKNIEINKSIVINKGGVAVSIANAAAASGAVAAVFGGGSFAEETVINRGGEIGELHAAETCETEEATVVKAIHAVCVAATGEEFPASHMLAETWIEGSYEGEVARCIAGATLKVTIGDVLQSDKGMAGTYEHGQIVRCGERDALRHYKDGMLKCVPAVPVRDCTERTNLRKYGSADFFFAYRADVCATRTREAATDAEMSSVSLDGGVGN
jgi:hypothetical protein